MALILTNNAALSLRLHDAKTAASMPGWNLPTGHRCCTRNAQAKAYMSPRMLSRKKPCTKRSMSGIRRSASSCCKRRTCRSKSSSTVNFWLRWLYGRAGARHHRRHRHHLQHHYHRQQRDLPFRLLLRPLPRIIINPDGPRASRGEFRLMMCARCVWICRVCARLCRKVCRQAS